MSMYLFLMAILCGLITGMTAGNAIESMTFVPVLSGTMTIIFLGLAFVTRSK